MKTIVDPYIRKTAQKEPRFASDDLDDLAWNTCKCFKKLLSPELSLFGEIIKAAFIETVGENRFSQKTETFIDLQFQIVIRLDPEIVIAVRWDEWRKAVHIGRIIGNNRFENGERVPLSELRNITGANEAEIRAKIIMTCVKKRLKKHVSDSRAEIDEKLSELKELENFADSATL